MESQILAGYSSSPLQGRFMPLRRLAAAVQRMSVQQRWQIAVYLVAIFPGLWIVFMTQGNFNTPDEFSRNFAASTFAEHLKFTFSDEVTTVAEAGSVAPRGFSLSDGAAVPNHALGFLLLLGIVHTVLPDILVSTTLVLMSGLVFLVWANVVNRLVNRTWFFTGALVVGVAPLWYWAARPYMDTAVITLLLGVAVLLLITAYQQNSVKHFRASIAVLSLASLLRTPDAIFIGIVILAFAAVFIRHTRTFRWADSRDLYLWIVGSQLVVFILPTLVLNWATNGSPFTLGYTIFLSQEYPSEHSAPTNAIALVFSALKQAIVPGNFDVRVLRNGLIYQMVFMNPALFVLGITGLWAYRAHVQAAIGKPGLVIAAIAAFYLFVSHADGSTFGAFQTAPDLDISLVRYWVPVYLLLAVGTAFSLRMLPPSAHLPVIGLIVVQSVFIVFYTGTTPVPHLIDTIRANTDTYETALNEVVEEDAVVVVTSSQDKWVALSRRTIGVWNPTPETLANVSNTIVALVERGVPVYLLDDRPTNRLLIAENVESRDILLNSVQSAETGISFVRFNQAPQVLTLDTRPSGGFSTLVDKPVPDFNLTVMNDGSSTNYVANPSFEESITGWSVRGMGEVAASSEQALYGNRSLRMEFADSEVAGDEGSARVNLVTQEIPEGFWQVRARVMPELLEDSVAALRIHVRDSSGNLLDRGYEEIDTSSDSFVVLETPVSELPEGAHEILIQLVVIPQSEGASARVFWDGIELLSDASSTYCDGDTNGCEWQGEPHLSTSSRESALETIKVVSNSRTVTFDGPATQGASLWFHDSVVSLVDADGEPVSVPEPLDWTVDEPLRVEFEAAAMPLIVYSTDE